VCRVLRHGLGHCAHAFAADVRAPLAPLPPVPVLGIDETRRGKPTWATFMCSRVAADAPDRSGRTPTRPG
jgi:hypothetical protein